MKITVHVKLNAKQESIEKLPDGSLLVRVGVPPVDGKANKRIIELLSEYFNRPKSAITCVHGERGKRKIFEIK